MVSKMEDLESELLQAKRDKEIEFAEIQRVSKEENGCVSKMMLNEHRIYLVNMDETRKKEVDQLEKLGLEKAQQKKDAFERKNRVNGNSNQQPQSLSSTSYFSHSQGEYA